MKKLVLISMIVVAAALAVTVPALTGKATAKAEADCNYIGNTWDPMSCLNLAREEGYPYWHHFGNGQCYGCYLP